MWMDSQTSPCVFQSCCRKKVFRGLSQEKQIHLIAFISLQIQFWSFKVFIQWSHPGAKTERFRRSFVPAAARLCNSSSSSGSCSLWSHWSHTNTAPAKLRNFYLIYVYFYLSILFRFIYALTIFTCYFLSVLQWHLSQKRIFLS